ncbi:hypothetical protein B0H11DRAFT_1814098, partial [Mycena galericulata]
MREYTERAEENRLRETDASRMKSARKRADATERMQRFRDRRRAEKIADGWIPGQKRKYVALVDVDDNADITQAEVSRPRRQFKEDAKKNKKPNRRKQKEKNKKRDSKLTNWFHPLLFPQIVTAAARAGKPWKPSAIVREARKLNMGAFWKLTEQVVGGWIDKEAKARGESKWKESVLRNVEHGKGNAPGGQTTRTGILQPYPELRKLINDQLTSLRVAGVALTLLTIHAIMVAHIKHGAPGLLGSTVGSDGSKFRCSESFVHRYLRNTLGWSQRRATKAGQKLPANHEKVIDDAFLREALLIRNYGVPAALRVNTDQTQLVYQQGADSTWNLRGAKQVATVGQEEKRAFTLVPSISASGVLLPMQAVFGGKTTASCPSTASKRYDEAIALGYSMVPSLSGTYWSNHGTMHSLVDEIIAPYFDAVKKHLNLSPKQFSIWKIDCWSVHKSKEFRAWMKKHHPTIILLFIPGGCT